jgi:two-component sensor histidine kinase
MTKHIVQLPNPDESLLLRELNHRINNELTCAICTVSAKAVESDNVAVKAALLDVADPLHQCADVHRALHMPDQGRLTASETERLEPVVRSWDMPRVRSLADTLLQKLLLPVLIRIRTGIWAGLHLLRCQR